MSQPDDVHRKRTPRLRNAESHLVTPQAPSAIARYTPTAHHHR